MFLYVYRHKCTYKRLGGNKDLLSVFFKISIDMSFFTNFRIGKPRHARGFFSACLFLMQTDLPVDIITQLTDVNYTNKRQLMSM